MNNPAPIGHNEMSKYDQLLESVEKAEDQASKCAVNDNEGADKAVFLIKSIRENTKFGEDSRKTEKAPFLEQGKAVDLKFKPLIDRLKEAGRIVQDKLNPFIRAERKAAQEAARKAEEERASLAKENNVAPPKPLKKPAFQHKTDLGITATTRETWHFEIMDELQIPDQFWMINEKAIKAAVAAGERNIAGVKIFTKTTTVVR